MSGVRVLIASDDSRLRIQLAWCIASSQKCLGRSVSNMSAQVQAQLCWISRSAGPLLCKAYDRENS